MFRCTIHLTCETWRYCLGCSSNWLTIIHLFTISFLFGDIVVSLVHQFIMISFISCGKTSEWPTRLGLIQKALWIVSNWTYLPIVFLMFYLLTPDDLTTPLLLLIVWLDANVQIMSLATTSSILRDPSKWTVRPYLKLPKISILHLIESSSFKYFGNISLIRGWVMNFSKYYIFPSFVL